MVTALQVLLVLFRRTFIYMLCVCLFPTDISDEQGTCECVFMHVCVCVCRMCTGWTVWRALWRTQLHPQFYEKEPQGSWPHPRLPCFTLMVSLWPPILHTQLCWGLVELFREGKPHFLILRHVPPLEGVCTCVNTRVCPACVFRQTGVFNSGCACVS